MSQVVGSVGGVPFLVWRQVVVDFGDADDVFLPQHLIAGWSSLNNNATVAWVKTGIAIAENQGGERILAEWKEAMENGAPTNLAIRRSIFIFSEGYSPLDMFRRDHEDVMFTHAIEYVRQRLPIAGLTDEGQPHQQRRFEGMNRHGYNPSYLSAESGERDLKGPLTAA